MKKVDANQKVVVDQLRRIGCSVTSIAQCGKGVPDLIVGFKKKNYLIELKDGNKKPSARKLTPDEIEFHAKWRGQVAVCNSFDEILKLINN